MHFSTKERVPLLVCLEVQEVQVPTRLSRSASAAGATALATASPGSNNSSGGSGGGSAVDTGVSAGTGDGVTAIGAEEGVEHAGEGGLMDRFRGTVRSFVKVRHVARGVEVEDDPMCDKATDGYLLFCTWYSGVYYILGRGGWEGGGGVRGYCVRVHG